MSEDLFHVLDFNISSGAAAAVYVTATSQKWEKKVQASATHNPCLWKNIVADKATCIGKPGNERLNFLSRVVFWVSSPAN